MDRKRKRHSEVDVHWTASRCRRLLRPIASRILPLRRLSYITDSQNTQDDSSLTSTSTLASKGGKEGNVSLDPAWFPTQKRDPHLKKYSSHPRPSQTEKSSTRNNTFNRQDNALILLPTPFKARALRRGTPLKQQRNDLDPTDSPSIGRRQPLKGVTRAKRDPFARARLAKQSAELQDRENFERIFELHQGVSDGLSLLLQRTAPTPIDKSSSARKGVPSLLNMCLRKVPDYIQAEEEWRKSIDEDDDTDVAMEVYEELESLGVSPGHGWSGLRDVVMAHGIKLVRGIIQDKLVSRNTRAELANMPLRHGLDREAEELHLAYAHSLPLKRPYNADSSLFDGCLAGLQDIGFKGADSTKNSTHVRILDDLFNIGRLRLSWLASRDMVKFSSETIRTLASHSGAKSNIIKFLHGRIAQAARAELEERNETQASLNSDPSPKLEVTLGNTVVSTVTVLTAIVLIEQDAPDLHQNRQSSTVLARTLIYSIAIDILRQLQESTAYGKTEEYTHIVDKGRSNSVCFAVLASTLILRVNQPTSDTGYVSLAVGDILQAMVQIHNKRPAKFYGLSTMTERASVFLCDLARCCGQSLNSNSQEYLEYLVQCLMKHAETGSHSEKTHLRQLGLESSLHFAKISATRESRQFMEIIENTMLRQGPLQLLSPNLKSGGASSSPAKRRGLRWEEGLCEWIAATPVATAKSRRHLGARHKTTKPSDQSMACVEEESDINDSGYLSALQETPAPRRKSALQPLLMTSPDILGMDSDCYSLTGFESHVEPKSPKTASVTHSPQFDNAHDLYKQDMLQTAELDHTPGEATPSELPTTTGSPIRPKKRRKTRTTNHPRSQSPIPATADSSGSTSHPLAPPKPLQPSSPKTSAICQTTEAEDDEDELAMSCKKPRPQPRLLPSKRTSLLSRNGRRVHQIVRDDDSGDELGL